MVGLNTVFFVRFSVGRILVSLDDERGLLYLEFTKPSLEQAWQTVPVRARLKFDGSLLKPGRYGCFLLGFGEELGHLRRTKHPNATRMTGVSTLCQFVALGSILTNNAEPF